MLLSQFNYSILSSGLTVAGLGTPEMNSISAHLPLTDIKIDFENGIFRMEADRNYIMAANTGKSDCLYNYKAERIKIETVINPCGIIDLGKVDEDGIIFSMEGVTADDSNLKACYGLMTVEQPKPGKKLVTNERILTFYICDAVNPECEIKFALPLCSVATNEELN